MHCSVFVFRDVLYSNMWPMMCGDCVVDTHTFRCALLGAELIKGCLTMQRDYESPVCLKKLQ